MNNYINNTIKFSVQDLYIKAQIQNNKCKRKKQLPLYILLVVLLITITFPFIFNMADNFIPKSIKEDSNINLDQLFNTN